MSAKTLKLEFDGYWRARNISGLPAAAGIYCVYACTYNSTSDTVNIRKLLYIGEAGNINDRISGHEKWVDWKRELYSYEEVCFSAAKISPESDRQRSEAAMIIQHKPPCNTEYVSSFPFDQTTILTEGRNYDLKSYFTVNQTPQISFSPRLWT